MILGPMVLLLHGQIWEIGDERFLDIYLHFIT